MKNSTKAYFLVIVVALFILLIPNRYGFQYISNPVAIPNMIFFCVVAFVIIRALKKSINNQVPWFVSKRTWVYQYGAYTIMAKNFWNGCELYVNGRLMDEAKGMFATKLRGKLDNGEEVRAKMKSGLLTIKCSLFVGKQKLRPTQ